jgi:hypothetical protein
MIAVAAPEDNGRTDQAGRRRASDCFGLSGAGFEANRGELVFYVSLYHANGGLHKCGDVL